MASSVRLEDRTFAILVTLRTKVVHRNTALVVASSERAGGELVQLILLLLCLPFLQFRNLFFQLAYRLNELPTFLVRRKHAVLSVDYNGLEFEPLGLEGLSVAERNRRLGKILDRLERAHLPHD